MGTEGSTVGTLNLGSGFRVHAGTAQADKIQSHQPVALTDDAVRGYVLADRAVAMRHRQFTDMDELVECCAAAEEGVIFNVHMPAQKAVIGDDILIADGHVMAQMASRHEEVVITDACPSPLGSAAVNGHVFAQVVTVAYTHTALKGGVKGEILRVFPNDGCASYVITRANLDLAAKLGMCGNPAA